MEVESLKKKCLPYALISILQMQSFKSKMVNYFQEVKNWDNNVMKDHLQDFQIAILETICELDIPISLKEDIRPIIPPFLVELYWWLKHFYLLDCWYPSILDDISWLSNGTVDDLATVKTIIKRDFLNLNVRIRLACMHCVQKDVIRTTF